MGNDHTAWMPVYWRDLLAETAHFSPAQFGAYCLLIAAYWNSRGALSADPERLRRIARMTAEEWAEAAPAIAERFQIDAGLWGHARLDAELAKAEARYQQKAAAGSKGGKAKGLSAAQAKATGRFSEAPAPPNQAESQAHESPSGDSVLPNQTKPEGSASDDLEPPAFLDRRSKPHGTRITPDWSPDESGLTFAADLGLDRRTTNNIAAQFRDYWKAKPGRDGTKTDWTATWRTWLRRHIDDHGSGPWPADGGRRPQGHRQGRGSVLAAVRSLIPQS
jgi:uncharacterized protein YdaU (DUF1376 family)